MVAAAFAALTLALAALCLPRARLAALSSPWWLFPFTVALALAAAGGVVSARGLLVVLSFAGGCILAHRAAAPVVRVAAHAVMLTACAGLFLHIVPGFDNPRLLSGVVVSPGAAPYEKYLNFDKGVAGLFLLGLYLPRRTADDEGLRRWRGGLWRWAVVTLVVMALSLGFGFVRWDVKLPPWWALWLWSMVFLTALPEEALARGMVQEWLTRAVAAWSGDRHAAAFGVATAGALFGLAHAGGGAVYVVLATVAGAGYGWIYATTRSIGAAILAHAALNTIHFVFFTYPSLAPGAP